MLQLGCLSVWLLLVSRFAVVQSFVFARPWQFRMPSLSRVERKVYVSKNEVYIGNLPEGYDDSVLKSLVSEKAPGVVSVIVAPYRQGGASYAYVDFSEPRFAKDAVSLLHGSTVSDNRLDVHPRVNGTNIYLDLGNLTSFNHTELRNNVTAFLGYDAVKRMRVLRNHSGRYGANVEFYSTEETVLALDRLSGNLVFEGQTIPMSLGLDKPELCVYLGNLDPSLSYTQVKSMVGEILGGEDLINTLRLPPNEWKNASKGFAFVEFFTPEQADRALRELPQYKILDRQLRVDTTKYNSVCDDPERMVYLHHVSRNVTALQVVQMVEELIGEQGAVESATFGLLGIDHYCCVAFIKPASRVTALTELRGVSLMGRPINISPTLIVPHGAVVVHGAPRAGAVLTMVQNPTGSRALDSLSRKQSTDSTLFLRGIPLEVSTQELTDWLHSRLKTMPVRFVKRGADRGGVLLNYAHVEFFTPEDAQTALGQLHNTPLRGAVVTCAPCRPHREDFYPLVVSNLAPDWTEGELNQMLTSVLGPIRIAKASFSPPAAPGASTAVAEVKFVTLGDRMSALRILSGMEVEGRKLRVQIIRLPPLQQSSVKPTFSTSSVSRGAVDHTTSESAEVAAVEGTGSESCATEAAQETGEEQQQQQQQQQQQGELTAEAVATPPPRVSHSEEEEVDEEVPANSETSSSDSDEEAESSSNDSSDITAGHHSSSSTSPLPDFIQVGGERIRLVYDPDNEDEDDAVSAAINGGIEITAAAGLSESREEEVNEVLQQVRDHLPFSAWPAGNDETDSAVSVEDIAAPSVSPEEGDSDSIDMTSEQYQSVSDASTIPTEAHEVVQSEEDVPLSSDSHQQLEEQQKSEEVMEEVSQGEE